MADSALTSLGKFITDFITSIGGARGIMIMLAVFGIGSGSGWFAHSAADKKPATVTKAVQSKGVTHACPKYSTPNCDNVILH